MNYLIESMYVDRHGNKSFATSKVAGWQNVIQEIADGHHGQVVSVGFDVTIEAAEDVRAHLAGELRNPSYELASWLQNVLGLDAAIAAE